MEVISWDGHLELFNSGDKKPELNQLFPKGAISTSTFTVDPWICVAQLFSEIKEGRFGGLRGRRNSLTSFPFPSPEDLTLFERGYREKYPKAGSMNIQWRWAQRMAFLLATVLSVGCDKEDHSKWKVDSRESEKGAYLKKVYDFDYMEEDRPFRVVEVGENIVWSEGHLLSSSFFRAKHRKAFTVEIPDSTGITDFRYEDDELKDSIKCYVGHGPYPSGVEGFFRVENGYVEGHKTSGGDWNIDFKVLYGGKNEDKYRLVKGADH
ncbi:MAG: hypothetical protein ABEH43_03825 [Flavobacteriales bacterium]